MTTSLSSEFNLSRAPFSASTRKAAWDAFERETYDVLVVGGGITGAGVAREARCRGLSVALVEAQDFASGTSSASSKLIHGGLRYLEGLEFGLVFESLSERSLLLRTAPNLVRPLEFYLPVYRSDSRGMSIVSVGLWLYDALSLFRTPGVHERLSRKTLLERIPGLEPEGLKGGFRYYDASMWDDVLAVETVRDAAERGAQVATRAVVQAGIYEDGRLVGVRVQDADPYSLTSEKSVEVRARQVIVCGGPWTDQLGSLLTQGSGKSWNPWLSPSQGVHLVFDLKRLPVPGALVMSHPDDGRIAFVIPRPDYGPGVTLVGTTDGPAPEDPARVQVAKTDVDYLLRLLSRYFPSLRLTAKDVLSATIGVRPLFKGGAPGGSEGAPLQKVSREHHIATGPGGAIYVAGGKYTTYRRMAHEIVDFAESQGRIKGQAHVDTRAAINPAALEPVVEAARLQDSTLHPDRPLAPKLWERFGADARWIGRQDSRVSLPGFPKLDAQLRYCMRYEMVLKLEDFYFRRQALWLGLSDHGESVIDKLARVWAEERFPEASAAEKDARALEEAHALRAAIQKRESWRS